MDAAQELRTGLIEVGRAIRRPETLACRWRDRAQDPTNTPVAAVFLVLLACAVGGLSLYGLTMGLHRGADGMLSSAWRAPFSAGTAWSLSLPALYIFKSAAGSRLDLSTTVLAALITCSFGALAMLAGAPVNWFFSVTMPYNSIRWLVNVTVFAGVGVAMTDVFIRVMRALEPERSLFIPFFWLSLVGAIGTQLMLLLGLFRF